MTDPAPHYGKQLAELRQEVLALRGVAMTAMLTAKTCYSLAGAIAITHPDKAFVLQAFNAAEGASDGHMQYSTATDAELAQLAGMQEVVRALLT